MFLALIAAAATAAANPASPSYFSSADPPARFQGDATVTLQLSNQRAIDAACHPRFGAPPAGMTTQACQFDDRIVAPNPCTFPKDDRYAQLLCHELGHVNGWPPTHDR